MTFRRFEVFSSLAEVDSGITSPPAARHSTEEAKINGDILDFAKGSYSPSWLLSLNTITKKVTLRMAIPKETRKWKDHLWSWANCVAARGAAKAPIPMNRWN